MKTLLLLLIPFLSFSQALFDGNNIDGEIGSDLFGDKVDLSSVVDYNLIKTLDPLYSGSGFNNIVNADVIFIDPFNNNFELDTLSPAKDAGFILTPPILDDYFDRMRNGAPDLGALESQF